MREGNAEAQLDAVNSLMAIARDIKRIRDVYSLCDRTVCEGRDARRQLLAEGGQRRHGLGRTAYAASGGVGKNARRAHRADADELSARLDRACTQSPLPEPVIAALLGVTRRRCGTSAIGESSSRSPPRVRAFADVADEADDAATKGRNVSGSELAALSSAHNLFAGTAQQVVLDARWRHMTDCWSAQRC